MLNKLTPAELSRALSGLNQSEKLELLELLELREERKPEPVVDNRPSLESFVDEIRDQAAAQSSDLDAYTTAWQAHVAAVLRISERLAGDRPRVTEPPSSAALWQEFQEVTELARAEGHAPAWEIVKPLGPEAPQPDPLEAMRRASLPRAVQRDLEDSRVNTAEERIYASIRAEQRAADAEEERANKLLPYRDKAPPGQPPSWPDS